MRFETALYLSLPLLSQVYANPFPQNNGGNGGNNVDPQTSLSEWRFDLHYSLINI